MKVKREVRICDDCCGDDDDELKVGRSKCIICDKDLCDDCGRERYLIIGDDNEEEVRLMEYNCCEDCIKKSTLQPKKDKKFIDSISEQITHYLKQKVMLKEIEK